MLNFNCVNDIVLPIWSFQVKKLLSLISLHRLSFKLDLYLQFLLYLTDHNNLIIQSTSTNATSITTIKMKLFKNITITMCNTGSFYSSVALLYSKFVCFFFLYLFILYTFSI